MYERPSVMLHVVGTSIAWFTLGYVLPVFAQESPADVRARQVEQQMTWESNKLIEL